MVNTTGRRVRGVITYGEDKSDVVGNIPDRISRHHLSETSPSLGPCVGQSGPSHRIVSLGIMAHGECMTSLSVIATSPDIGSVEARLGILPCHRRRDPGLVGGDVDFRGVERFDRDGDVLCLIMMAAEMMLGFRHCDFSSSSPCFVYQWLYDGKKVKMCFSLISQVNK